MLSKSIVIRSDLDILLDLVDFEASTILKRKEDEEGDRERNIYEETILSMVDCNGCYQHL